MAKLSVDDLNALKQQHASSAAFQDKTYLMVCGGTGCHATGSIAVIEALRQGLAERDLNQKFKVVETGCNGFCAMGPIMVVQPGDIFYQKLSVDDIAERPAGRKAVLQGSGH